MTTTAPTHVESAPEKVSEAGVTAAHLTLEDLVTSIATDLMAVTGPGFSAAAEHLLHRLVDYFGVDLSFIRRNDHEIRATILVAEWPPRPVVPDPDPVGVVFFDSADPTFAATEHLTTELVTGPDEDDEDYQERVRQASGVQGVSMAMVPLLGHQNTVGIIGLIKFGARVWTNPEVGALRAVASLLAQLQGRLRAEERLRYLAYHDELTGLANRRHLAEHIAERLTPGRPPVTVIFLDLDRLKALNSFLGHAAGDLFLTQFAGRLTEWNAGRHFLARQGGDEFVVVLRPGGSESEAMVVGEALRELAKLPIRVEAEEVSRAVSIGIATGIPGISDVSTVLEQADQAMLSAKSSGGNAICLFTPEMRKANELKTDIELHLATAIRDGLLLLHYQPELDMAAQRVVRVEALVRWLHPTLGMLQPGTFIDVVEATNLAGELGRWVIQTALRQLKTWHRTTGSTDLQIGVNVSPAQLITVDFADTVAQMLADAELDGPFLTLEITEHAVMRDTQRALKTLNALRDLGVRIALDDFGTGYSSLAQLRSLPVDVLKIDRSFVQNLGSSPKDLAIVRMITRLAEAYGLEVVAEGVETDDAARILLELGCHRAQGYLFAKPGSAEDIRSFL